MPNPRFSKEHARAATGWPLRKGRGQKETRSTLATVLLCVMSLRTQLKFRSPNVVTGRAHSAEAKQPAQRTWGTRSLPMLFVGELPIRRAHPTAGAALPFEDLRLQ